MSGVAALSSFMCRDAEERAWTLDMHERIRPVSRAAAGLLSVAVFACFPWLEPWSYVPVVLGGVVFAGASALVDRYRRIDAMVLLLPVVQALTVVGIVVNGRELDGDLLLTLFALVGACGGFPARLAAAFSLYTAALIVGVTLGLHPAEFAAEPMVMLFPLVSVVCLALMVTAMREATMAHRLTAVLDVLTGLLNRGALVNRVGELTQQSKLEPLDIGVVVLDIDHFKHVNDSYGHQRGDEVLAEFGRRLRRQLRAFDLAYRVGGEEFVVLVPGGTPRQTRELAERLVHAVRAEPLAGLTVTVSAGVATSSAGTFDYDAVFARADAALYSAKRSGRDQVAAAATA